ncbi:MAG: hypothetical protein ABIR70_16355 [Bryobacteraceae bacterium]
MASAEQDALELLQKRSSAADFEECLQAADTCTTLRLPEWLSFLAGLSKVAASPLDWLESHEQDWLRDQVTRRLLKLLIRGNPDRPPARNDVRSALQPFTDWIATQSDYEVVAFCWE